MKAFKTWWNEQEIICGEGGMDAAEQAWDAAQKLTAEYIHDVLLDYCESDEECRTEVSNFYNTLHT